MSIIGLKLVSGEDIIGEEVLENLEKQFLTEMTGARKNVRLKNPVIVLMHPPTSEGKVNIAFMPYLMISEEKEFTFTPDHVITTFTPNIDLRNGYSTQFGSGIALARAGDLPPFAGRPR